MEHVDNEGQGIALVQKKKQAPKKEKIKYMICMDLNSECIGHTLDWSIQEISELHDEQPAYKFAKRRKPHE